MVSAENILKHELHERIPTLKSITVSSDVLEEQQIKQGSSLTIEYNGHRLSYRVTEARAAEGFIEMGCTHLLLELVKVHY